MTPDRLRVFFAVDISDETRRRAVEHVAALRGSVPAVKIKWDAPEKLHVTVKFLGDVDRDRLAALSTAAGTVCGDLQPFPLAVSGTGAFPPKGPARVTWLGVDDPAGGLDRLQRGIEDACASLGFPRETRTYHPHVTLARLKGLPAERPLVEAHRAANFSGAPDFQVTELLLMRSELSPQGSRYSVLKRFALGARSIHSNETD